MCRKEVEQWFENGRAEEFDALAAAYTLPRVMEALLSAHPSYEDQGVIAARLRGAAALRPVPRRVRTVGLFNYRLFHGGVEHVISQLAFLWAAAGYRVVLFTDLPPSEEDYPLPEGTVRYLLPDTFLLTEESRKERYGRLQAALRESGVDVMVHHAWLSFNLLWDLLAVKTLGIPFIEYIHGAFSCQLVEGRPHEMDQLFHLTRILALADSIVSLSDAFAHFWRSFNPAAVRLLDPCERPGTPDPAIRRDPGLLVWIGRIAPEKQPWEAVRILHEVRKTLPAVRLKIVGGTDEAFRPYEDRLRKEIADLELEDAVSLEGYHEDVSPYYQEASLLLMTSAHEGFGLVMAEAKYYSLPCVAYDMPYNYFAEDGRGFVSVPMNDARAAADAVVRLLSDPAALAAAGEEAKKSAEAFSAPALTEQWNQLLEKFEAPPAEAPAGRPTGAVVLSALLADAHLGYEKLQQQAEALQADLRGGLLRSVFDAEYYAGRYPDLQAVFGKDDNGLLNHFLEFGMSEGRQASPLFDPQAYRDRYPDLRQAFGDNLKSYYLHFLLHGRSEGRTGV